MSQIHYWAQRFSLTVLASVPVPLWWFASSPARKQAWEDVKSTNPVMKKFSEPKRARDESETSFVSGLRTVTDIIGSWFDENETAQVW